MKRPTLPAAMSATDAIVAPSLGPLILFRTNRAAFLKIVLCAALLVTAMPAESVNFRFLDFSPVRHFNDEDWRLLRETADDVIENKPDGTRTNWENPDSGASGTVTAIRTTNEEDGTVCRLIRVENLARGMSGRMDVTACKEPGEEWRLVSR